MIFRLLFKFAPEERSAQGTYSSRPTGNHQEDVPCRRTTIGKMGHPFAEGSEPRVPVPQERRVKKNM